MIWALVFFVAGLVILVFGAEALVKGASSLARRLKISELAIALTIVAFGTSAPELIVNLIASANGQTDIGLGNIVGSNIFNILCILGIAGLIRPLSTEHNTTWKEIPIALAAAAGMWLLVQDSHLFGAEQDMLGRIDGIILLVCFVLFLVYIWRSMRDESSTETDSDSPQEIPLSLPVSIFFTLLGLAALFAGGKIVVTQAVTIAEALGVSQKLIALTIVAAGTSLPELATSAIAAYRNRPNIAVGNIVGSNIFNIFLILGVSAATTPIPFPASFNFDMLVMVLATILLFVFMFTGKRNRIDRPEALLFLLLFTAYTTYIII